MDKRLIGEFMGTLVLVFLGNGVNANVLLKKSAGENSGWIVITTGWALAVMAGSLTGREWQNSTNHVACRFRIGDKVDLSHRF